MTNTDTTGSRRSSHLPTTTATKRGGSSHERPRKRGRYVSRACDQCRRQKIRCNGQKPCNRCEKRHRTECCYLEGQHACNCPDCGGNYAHPVTEAAVEAAIEAAVEGEVEGEVEGAQSIIEDNILSNDGNTMSLSNILESIQSQTARLINGAKVLDDLATTAKARSNSHGSSIAVSPGTEATLRLRPQKSSLPLFHGPTSPAFCISLVETNLDKLETSSEANSRETDIDGGIASSDTGKTAIDDGNSSNIPNQQPASAGADVKSDINLTLDLLTAIGLEEALRLALVYDDLVGVMHPFLDAKSIELQIRELYSILGTGSTTNELMIPKVDGLQMDKDNFTILVIVLAIALTAKAQGYSEMGRNLYKSLQAEIQAKLVGEETTIDGSKLLILLSFYHFYSDDWRLAWRRGRIAVRIALELGLHRRDVLFRMFPEGESREMAVKVFWSIYVLDRQWSFIEGLPKGLQDVEIDPHLPEPVNAPYLKAMIRYARLGGSSWDSLNKYMASIDGCPRDDHESLGIFQYRLEQWQKSIPEELQFVRADKSDDTRLQFIRALLYLRANQLRILMLRPFLESFAGITVNRHHVVSAVQVACDTIRVLVDINASGNIYHTQEPICNLFLLSALGILLLVVVHQPSSFSTSSSPPKVEPGIGTCRELFLGLDLLRSHAESSLISKRLWREISAIISRLRLLHLLPIPSSHISDTCSSQQRSDGWDNILESTAHPSIQSPSAIPDIIGLSIISSSWRLADPNNDGQPNKNYGTAVAEQGICASNSKADNSWGSTWNSDAFIPDMIGAEELERWISLGEMLAGP